MIEVRELPHDDAKSICSCTFEVKLVDITTPGVGVSTMSLTKHQAIEAMHKGCKVKHEYFTDDEWMCEKNGKYEFEDGCRCDFDRFWFDRKDDCWRTGWSIFDIEHN